MRQGASNLDSIPFVEQCSFLVFLVALLHENFHHVLVEVRILQFNGLIGRPVVFIIASLKIPHGFIIGPGMIRRIDSHVKTFHEQVGGVVVACRHRTQGGQVVVLLIHAFGRSQKTQTIVKGQAKPHASPHPSIVLHRRQATPHHRNPQACHPRIHKFQRIPFRGKQRHRLRKIPLFRHTNNVVFLGIAQGNLRVIIPFEIPIESIIPIPFIERNRHAVRIHGHRHLRICGKVQNRARWQQECRQASEEYDSMHQAYLFMKPM